MPNTDPNHPNHPNHAPYLPKVAHGDLIQMWRPTNRDGGWRLLVLYCPACAGSHLLSLHALSSYDVFDNTDDRIVYSCPSMVTSDVPISLLDDVLDAVRKQVTKETGVYPPGRT